MEYCWDDYKYMLNLNVRPLQEERQSGEAGTQIYVHARDVSDRVRPEAELPS